MSIALYETPRSGRIERDGVNFQSEDVDVLGFVINDAGEIRAIVGSPIDYTTKTTNIRIVPVKPTAPGNGRLEMDSTA